MGSPLGQVIVWQIWKKNVIPKLSTHMTNCKRYVDDTKAYISVAPSIMYYPY